MTYHPYVPSCSCASCTRKSLRRGRDASKRFDQKNPDPNKRCLIHKVKRDGVCARCGNRIIHPKNYQSGDYAKQSAEFDRQHGNIAFGPRTIWVRCSTCGIDYDESKVEHLDIEEGLQGEDILTFVCPKGHETKSRRRG